LILGGECTDTRWSQGEKLELEAGTIEKLTSLSVSPSGMKLDQQVQNHHSLRYPSSEVRCCYLCFQFWI
jgi:primosomal replication protein N